MAASVYRPTVASVFWWGPFLFLSQSLKQYFRKADVMFISWGIKTVSSESLKIPEKEARMETKMEVDTGEGFTWEIGSITSPSPGEKR